MKTGEFFVLLLLIITAGCSSRGFRKDEIYAQLNQKAETTDSQIGTVLRLRPQLPRPFSLAIHFSDSSLQNDHGWRWSDAEKDAVVKALEPLKTKGIVKNIVVIAKSTLQDEDLPSVRLAAARYGADAVLLVKGAKDMGE